VVVLCYRLGLFEPSNETLRSYIPATWPLDQLENPIRLLISEEVCATHFIKQSIFQKFSESKYFEKWLDSGIT
jgi:hypothetical protein